MKVVAGVALGGDVAKVWSEALEIGVLYGWQLSGSDGSWAASAVKHRFSEGFAGGEVELRFCLVARDAPRVELRGRGEMFSPYVADGKVHRETVLVKGESLWLQTEPNG
jgi:hypothetical protein